MSDRPQLIVVTGRHRPHELFLFALQVVLGCAYLVSVPAPQSLAALVPSWLVFLWAAGLVCVPFVVYLVLAGSPASWLVLAASLFFVVFYSAPPLRLKEVPFADSITSSIHFFSPAVYALVLAGAAWTWQLGAVIIAFALWGVASHAFGAVQDVVADREADISSIATARGARWTVWFALACYAGAGLVMLATAWPGPLAALVAILYIATVWPFRDVTDETAERATAGWRRFLWINQVAGFVVTMLLIWFWFLTG